MNAIVVAGALISGSALLVAQRERPAELAGLSRTPNAAEEAEAKFEAVKRADPYRSAPAVYDAAEREALAGQDGAGV